MVAMDVVDTLRHQQGLVDRELDSQGRRDRLLDRLRELYQAQGINVTDQILEEGIVALEQERFKYQPVERSWKTRLAGIWVSRERWGKPIGFLAVLGSLFFGFYLFTEVLPERSMRNKLPNQIQSSLASIEAVAKNALVIDSAREIATFAEQGVSKQDYGLAQKRLTELEKIKQQLQMSYVIRIVSDPEERSGIYRIPDVNESSRNYYLIVEAVDDNNSAIELPILSEETNKTSLKRKWGLRVSENVYQQVGKDKTDDGIIQSNQVGEKRVGYMQPTYSIDTTGGMISEWEFYND